MYKYESAWKSYVFPEPKSKFASDKEIKNLFTEINLKDDKYQASGPPLIVDGDKVTVNDETEHWFVVGETGSKKTRSFVKPLLPILIGAGESFFAIDVKGELSTDPTIRSCIKENDYDAKYIDFRDFKSDGYNIFEYATELYKKGRTDKAMANITSIVDALAKKYDGSKADPFWELMSCQHLIPVIHMLMDIADNNPEYEKYINMLSVASFAGGSGTEILTKIDELYMNEINNNSIQMLRNVLYSPEKTRASIVAVTSSLIQDFLLQEDLLRMLSESTIDIQQMYERPTCVFLIIPDETSAYDGIAGLLMDIFYNQLIEVYTDEYQNKKKPQCRINWVCDEFCNVRINDMKAKISASRGREMRWFLVAQSLRQLQDTYDNEYATIIGNCKNIMFLQSSDPEMLSYISDMSGTTTISPFEKGEPLLPVEALKDLKKTYEYKEAVFIRDDIIYKATLPDIDKYNFPLKKVYKKCKIPRKLLNSVKTYTPQQLYSDLKNKRIRVPFDGLYDGYDLFSEEEIAILKRNFEAIQKNEEEE